MSPTSLPSTTSLNKAALIVAAAPRDFKQLGAALAELDDDDNDNTSVRLLAMGKTYIEFAMGNPARYRLMFATGIPSHKSDDDVFCDAAAHTFAQLTDAIAAVAPGDSGAAEDEEAVSEQGAHCGAVRPGRWVHGAVMLQIDGTFSSLQAEEEGHAAPLPPMEQMMPVLLAHVAAGLSGDVA